MRPQALSLPLGYLAVLLCAGAMDATAQPIKAHSRTKQPTWPIAAPSPACPHGDPIFAQWNFGSHGVQKRRVEAYTLKGSEVGFYESGLEIDVDGAPDAYHPPTRSAPSGHPPAMDSLADAGYPRSCSVLVCMDKGKLPHRFAITPDGPFVGFFVSKSSLQDRRKKLDGSLVVSRADYHAYVDASAVPYIAVAGKAIPVLHLQRSGPDRHDLGELAYVVDLKTGKHAAAIFADGGTNNTLGEGSIRLARALGYSDRQATAQFSTIESGILTIVFPGSAAPTPWPRDAADIDKAAADRFNAWGGMDRVKACFPDANIEH